MRRALARMGWWRLTPRKARPPALAWTSTTLVDVLRDTLMFARLRVQPPTTFSRGGLMPFAWLGQRPGNTGISFSL